MEIDDEYKPVSLSDFSHICRFCAKGNNLKPLELYQYLLDLFKAITNIEVSHKDGLPGNTCSQCVQTLENIMDFVYLAENNDSNLRQTLVNRNDAEIEYDKMVIRGPGTDVISFQNFAHICRFCLHDNNLNPLQQHKYLLDVIKNKLAIEVDPDDNLPQNICITCIKMLEGFSNFIISSKNNDGDLKQAILKIKVEPDFDESDGMNPLQTTDKIKLENENIVYIKTELVQDANEPNSNEDVDKSSMQINNEDVSLVTGCGEQENLSVDHLKEEIQSECETEETVIIKQEYESICQEEEMIPSENCNRQEPVAQFQKYETAMKAPVNPDPKPFHCTSCPKSYAYEAQLTIHYRTHTGERPFRCLVCRRTFARSSNLSVHMKSHGDDGKAYSCNTCEMSFNRKSELDGHLRLHGEKKFQCTTCLKHFANKQNLNTHMELHTGQRAFKCPECPKEFSRKQHFKVHIRIHMGENPYQCKVCLKNFYSSFSLSRHEGKQVCGKMLECEICTRKYMRLKDLEAHKRLHSGVKPFKCEFCPRTFFRGCLLRDHLKFHNPPELFACEICPKSFPHRGTLKRHMMSHTGEKPFSCSQCSQTFLMKEDWRAHERKHKGENPFVCNLCESSFTNKRRWREHKKIHAKERPFGCHVCSKSFPTKVELDDHVTTAHLQQKTS
nr:zinc finger protein 883-like isoform X1 [Leptinotarsa decemlineata]